jgi:hypothetical protein
MQNEALCAMEKQRELQGLHPWLIGAAAGGVIVFMAIASVTWFPRLNEPWVGMTSCGGALFLGILISAYWRVLGSWRLWISLTTVVAFNAICILVFVQQIRQLSLWDIDAILGLELFATMFFLNWFLDAKKVRVEITHKKL